MKQKNIHFQYIHLANSISISNIYFKTLACFPVDGLTNPALLFMFQFYSYLHTVDNMKCIALFRIQFLHIVNRSAFLVECQMCAFLGTHYEEVNEPSLRHRMYSRKIQMTGWIHAFNS